ncbi:hypothetical protein [Fluviicola sp.]|uniref:hypothetical protein n=1 Tax=Fluviicola sp. TaxID=1917219 RepID=UPI0031CFF438
MKKYLWIISLSLYLLAFILPVYSTTKGPATFGQGIPMLALGWIQAFTEKGLALAWFANPLFIIALCTTKKYPVTSVFFAAFAILTALCFLRGGVIYLPHDATHFAYLTGIKIGYWTWLASMVVVLVGAVLRWKGRN